MPMSHSTGKIRWCGAYGTLAFLYQFSYSAAGNNRAIDFETYVSYYASSSSAIIHRLHFESTSLSNVNITFNVKYYLNNTQTNSATGMNFTYNVLV